MTLTRYKNVLHPRHEMFKIASVSRAPPQTPLGELTTLCRPLVVRGFLPSVAAASRLRRLQFHRLASGCGVRLSDPVPYLEALASPLVKFYFAPHGLKPNSAYGSVTFTLRIHKRPGHPGSPDVLSANRSLHWTGGSFMSLGLGQPWPCLDLLPLLPLLFGIAFHPQLVLLSYHPIFLRPYHFLKLVSFLGANRTTSASVCLWLFRGAI